MEKEAVKKADGVSKSTGAVGYVIFRIQDKNGRGPWKPGFSHSWVDIRKDHSNLLPWYEEFGRVDKKALFGMALGSGCRTIGQLKRWFTQSEYTKLKKYGYQAVKMKVGSILADSEGYFFITTD